MIIIIECQKHKSCSKTEFKDPHRLTWVSNNLAHEFEDKRHSVTTTDNENKVHTLNFKE